MIFYALHGFLISDHPKGHQGNSTYLDPLKKAGGQHWKVVFFLREKNPLGGARPPAVHRSPPHLIFGFRGLLYVFSGRVEEESVPTNISLRSGGDANPNFQEEMETRQKTVFWRSRLVQGLLQTPISSRDRTSHKPIALGMEPDMANDERRWTPRDASSWTDLETRSDKNLPGIMKIWGPRFGLFCFSASDHVCFRYFPLCFNWESRNFPKKRDFFTVWWFGQDLDQFVLFVGSLLRFCGLLHDSNGFCSVFHRLNIRWHGESIFLRNNS